LVRSWASAEVKVRGEGRLKSLEVLFKVEIKVSANIAVARWLTWRPVSNPFDDVVHWNGNTPPFKIAMSSLGTSAARFPIESTDS
jgi:homogentisate 1,2-dioxygenase